MNKRDQRIIRLCRERDRNAFDLLTREFGKPLYSFIYNMAGNHQATDDILQETFIKAYKGISKYEAGAGFGNWLFKVAYNQCLDWMKIEERRAGRERKYGEFQLENGQGRAQVEEAAVRREQAQHLRQALQALPERQRTALCLFAVQGFSIKEIAAIMDCSHGTVMSHLHRARRAMREKLSDEPQNKEKQE